MELNGPPERVCGVATNERGGRFSAGSLLYFTASESPFSHLMSALTGPLISPGDKGPFNGVGGGLERKDFCLCKRSQTEPTWTGSQMVKSLGDKRGFYAQDFCAHNSGGAQLCVLSLGCVYGAVRRIIHVRHPEHTQPVCA